MPHAYYSGTCGASDDFLERTNLKVIIIMFHLGNYACPAFRKAGT